MDNLDPKKKRKKPVLSDHKRVGKVLIPPFLQLWNLHEVSWADQTMPELLWLALLNDAHGVAEGTNLAKAVAQHACRVAKRDGKKWFGCISAFASLSVAEQRELCMSLDEKGELSLLMMALDPLCHLYPECPLSFVVEYGVREPADKNVQLDCLKRVVLPLYDKTSSESTFVLASAFYIAFVLDILKVHPSTVLAKFPEVQDYPESKVSRQIAAAMRAGISAFVDGVLDDKSSKWAAYFWNRGLALEPCELKREYIVGLESEHE